MTDLNKAELRRLAEAAQFGGGAHEDIEFSNQLDFHAACTPAAILSLLDDLDHLEQQASVFHHGMIEATKQRDQARSEVERLERNLQFTEQWYAVRMERLQDLGKANGIWNEMSAIIANGTADGYEPPSYARQLVMANHHAKQAEAERDRLRAETEALRSALGNLLALYEDDEGCRELPQYIAGRAAMAKEGNADG